LKDVEVGGWLWRVDLEDEVRSWLNKRAVKGVRIDDVWYPPAMIERIEIGKHTVEML
jgi:outer membrane receptor for ferrienterochelin and colicin